MNLAITIRKFDQPLIRLSQQKQLSWDDVAEFCDLLPAKLRCRILPRSIIVFRDSQGGYGDLALAAWAYEEAREAGWDRRSAPNKGENQ